MQSDYSNMEKLAREKEDENWRFRSFLKFYDDISEEEIDKLVAKIADEVSAKIDCSSCGRCCQVLSPVFTSEDQARLAGSLGLTIEQLKEQYLIYDTDEEPIWKMREAPCSFLKDNKCSVYEDRPCNCRDYPYLHKPDFTHRTWGMIQRTLTCPIVFYVLEKLKQELEFC